MMEELEAIFSKYQQQGQVKLLYETKIYVGQLEAA
jgi:hypothetical protein